MSRYEECLALSKAHGLYLDDRIERKLKGGLYGMFATEAIPKDTVVVSFPKASILPELSDSRYPTPDVKWPHSIARELQKGKDSGYQAHTKMLESIDELKEHSLYFFTAEEKQTLFQMSPILLNSVNDYFQRANNILNTIKEIEPELDEELVIQATLNSFSRCWESFGLLPVIDLFNHSDSQGVTLTLLEDDTKVGFVLEQDYEPGQQVWVSYGAKDIFAHALYFNYFDSTNKHIIDYARRAIQVLDSPEKLDIAKFISANYETVIFEHQGQKKMALHEDNLYILEEGPNNKLMEYFGKIGFTTLEELKRKQCSPLSAYMTYLSVINAFLGANNVDQFKLTKLPPKLQRFHQALKKEKKMLLANKAWVEKQINTIRSKAG